MIGPLLLALVFQAPSAEAALPKIVVHQKRGVVGRTDRIAVYRRLARHYEEKADYPSAIVVYDAILNRRPSDRSIARRMIRCYERMLRDELRNAKAAAEQAPPPPDVTPLPENAPIMDLLTSDEPAVRLPLRTPPPLFIRP